MKPLYSEPRKLSAAKYSDLMSLKPFIPPAYHAFYDNMPHSTAARQPEAEEYPDIVENE